MLKFICEKISSAGIEQSVLKKKLEDLWSFSISNVLCMYGSAYVPFNESDNITKDGGLFSFIANTIYPLILDKTEKDEIIKKAFLATMKANICKEYADDLIRSLVNSDLVDKELINSIYDNDNNEHLAFQC